MCIKKDIDEKMSGINGITDWFLKYILPVIIVPIVISGGIGYSAIKVMGNQQQNESKRIDQIEKSTNINRVELSKHNERLSKIEVLVESVNKSLVDNRKELRIIRSNLGNIEKIVVVLKDREERDHSE